MDHRLVYLGFLIACGGYALLKGGTPERIGAAIWIAGSVLTPLMRSWNVERYHQVEPAVMALDLLTFFAFLAVTVYANRFWPLWTSAIQVIGCLGHVAKALDPRIDPWAYYMMIAMGGYPICAILMAATLRHRQRIKRLGADRSWSVSFAP